MSRSTRKAGTGSGSFKICSSLGLLFFLVMIILYGERNVKPIYKKFTDEQKMK
jgi:hypothetical protein